MISFKTTVSEVIAEVTQKALCYGKVTQIRSLDYSDKEVSLMITFASTTEVITASVRMGGVIFGYTTLILKVELAKNQTYELSNISSAVHIADNKL